MADTLRWFAALLIVIVLLAFISGIVEIADTAKNSRSYRNYTEQQEIAVKRQAGYNKIYISLASIPGIFIVFMFANMYDNIEDIKEKLNEIERAVQEKQTPESETKKEYSSIVKNSAPRPLNEIQPMAPLPQEEQPAARKPQQEENRNNPPDIIQPPAKQQQEPQQERHEETPQRLPTVEPHQPPARAERAQRQTETPQQETAKQINHVSSVLLIVFIVIIVTFVLLYIINLPHP